MFELIRGIQEPKIDYLNIYTKALVRKAYELEKDLDNRTLIKQLVFYGVRFIITGKNQGSPELEFAMIEAIFAYIGKLTPSELITIFPISKIYEGERSGWKDYNYTMNELREFGMDKVIGFENVFSLLSECVNKDFTRLLMKYMNAMSELWKKKTGVGIAEQWAAEVGLPIYSRFRDVSTNKEYVRNSQTGKITRVFKVKPRNFKLLK